MLSIIVPVYNEEEVLPEFYGRLLESLSQLDTSNEIIFVNDGSTDNSINLINQWANENDSVASLSFSRNFGKEIATTAGLDYASGDAVVVIDADLQDPPELITEFYNYFLEGYDVVFGKRISRDGESWFKRSTSYLFYRILNRMSEVNIHEDVGDFRLLSRRALDSLKQLRERHRYMKGLFAWVGFSQKSVEYHRNKRFSGSTKWQYLKLWGLAIEGITSFTTAPLKVATYVGILSALAAFLYALYIFIETMFYGNPVEGYPSTVIIILFLGGVQLVAIGVIGEYLARIFNESKQRPLYIVEDYKPAKVLKNMKVNKENSS